MNQFFEGLFQKQVIDFITGLPCSIQKPYPPAKINVKNEQMANLLLSAFSDGGKAEMSAIAQYMNHSQTIDNQPVANVLLYIALVEMLHLQYLAQLIHSLGGNLRYWNSNYDYWSAGTVAYGGSLVNKLSLDIESEQQAINGYESLLRDIKNINVPELESVNAIILRLIEDENYHVSLLQQAYTENGGKL